MMGVFTKREIWRQTNIKEEHLVKIKMAIISQRERPGADSSLTDLERNQPSHHLEFRLLSSRSVRQ